MSNGHACCILGVCCPPGSPEQADALTQMIATARPGWGEEACKAAAKRVLAVHDHFRGVATAIDTSGDGLL